MNLPNGFVLDNSQGAAAPDGFVVDQPSQFSAPLPDGRNIRQARESLPEIGMSEAIQRGVQQGVTFNFGDELRGLIAAGGGKVGSDTEPAGPHNVLIGAYKMLIAGDPEAKRDYEAVVAQERDTNKRAAQERPYSTMAGNVAGAVAIPLGGALNAATLPARMGRGAAVGAGAGALYGAGEGEGAVDTASKALVGGALGGVAGGVAPPIVEGAIQAGKAALAPVSNAIRGALRPEDEAARRTLMALQKDAAKDPAAVNRLAPAEFAASVQNGGPAAIMDMGGETTRALARSAANTSPEGRDVLNKTINDRYEGQAGRVTDWLRHTFNFPDAAAQQEAIAEVGRTANRGMYAKAYSDGSKGIYNETLDQLGDSPVMRAAIKDAAESIGNKVAAGRAMQPLNEGRPTLEYWDQVKRSLDSQHSVLKRQGNSEAAADVDAVRKQLISALDREVPSYAKARETAAKTFGAQDALEAGQNFVLSKTPLGEARQALAKMSDSERKLFQDGFVSDFIDKINRTGDRRNVLNQIANTPEARAKLNIALGPTKAAELEAGLRVEGITDLARGAVQGNSTTARQLAELGLAGGVGLASSGGLDITNPQALANTLLAFGTLKGKSFIDGRVARHVAEMLVSNDPAKIQRGIQMIAKSKGLMDTFRRVDNRLAQVGASESPKGLLGIQAPVAGRAEDQ